MMNLKKHGKIFLNGVVVMAPAVITIYVVVIALWWFDKAIRGGIQAAFAAEIAPGAGILIGLGAIYAIGLLTRMWLFSALVRLGESLVEKIPLIKSLYSAVKDIMQFFGGPDKKARGRPARVRLDEKGTELMGVITNPSPEGYRGTEQQGRVAVYLPMSYQIGGFTVYVPRESVEEMEEMDVETLMKLALTAGVKRSSSPTGTDSGGASQGPAAGEEPAGPEGQTQ